MAPLRNNFGFHQKVNKGKIPKLTVFSVNASVLIFVSGCDGLPFESAFAVAVVPVCPTTVTELSLWAIALITSSVARNHHVLRTHLPTRISNNIIGRWRHSCFDCREDAMMAIRKTGRPDCIVLSSAARRVMSVSPTAISRLTLGTVANSTLAAAIHNSVAIATLL